MALEMIQRPEISDRFDADDIRRIRDYNSQRHAQMSNEEVIADIKEGANNIIRKYGLKIQYANVLR